eukprot:1000648-Rhodomonas_salina.2
MAVMSGTSIAYGTNVWYSQRMVLAVCGTRIPYGAIAAYAMSSTHIPYAAYLPMCMLRDVRYCHSVKCYAMCGTYIAYDPMVLPGQVRKHRPR